jgi:hypothetical protein
VTSREEQLQATIDRIALELMRERAAHRRTAEELDWAQEQVRVWKRAAFKANRELGKNV